MNKIRIHGSEIRVRDEIVMPMLSIVPAIMANEQTPTVFVVDTLHEWNTTNNLRKKCGVFAFKEVGYVLRELVNSDRCASLFCSNYIVTLYKDVSGWCLWGYQFHHSPDGYRPPKSTFVRKL